MIKAKIDADVVMRQYSSALRRLANLTGFSQKVVLKAEAGVILKQWAGRTKVATQDRTDNRSRVALGRKIETNSAPEVGDVSINAGPRGEVGRVWRRVKKPGRHFLLIGHITKNQKSVRWEKASGGKSWGQYTKPITAVLNWLDNVSSYLKRGRDAMGIARQSVVQIADNLGIDLSQVSGRGVSPEGVTKARAAIASNGRKYQNGRGYAFVENTKDVIDLFNTLPYARKIGMDNQLLYIMGGRAKFFQQSYAKGAFDSMRNTARAYPWLTVSAAA